MGITPTQAGIDPQFLPSTYLNTNGELTVPETTAREVAAGVEARATALPAAEKAAFLAMVKSPDFSPNASTTPSDLFASLDRYQAAARTIVASFSAPVSSADNAKILARLMVELGGLQRKEALDCRLAARQQAKAELNAQAGDLRAAADKAVEAAVVQMVVAVATAVISIVGSAVSIGGAMKNAGKLKDLNKGLQKADSLDDAKNVTKAADLDKAGDVGKANPAKKPIDLDAASDAGETKKLKLKVFVKETDGAGEANGIKKPANLDAGDSAPDAGNIKKSTNVDTPDDMADANVGNNPEFDLGMRKIASKEGIIQGIAGMAGTISSAGQGSAAAISSGATQESKYLEASASEKAAEAEETRGEGDLSREFQQSLDELLKAMINFLKEMQDAEVGQMSAITRA